MRRLWEARPTRRSLRLGGLRALYCVVLWGRKCIPQPRRAGPWHWDCVPLRCFRPKINCTELRAAGGGAQFVCLLAAPLHGAQMVLERSLPAGGRGRQGLGRVWGCLWVPSWPWH